MKTNQIIATLCLMLMATGLFAQQKKDAEVDACVKSISIAADKNRATMLSDAASLVSGSDKSKFVDSQNKIAKVNNANKAAGYTLQKCKDVVKLVEDEAKMIATMIAAANVTSLPPGPRTKCSDEGSVCKVTGQPGQVFYIYYGFGGVWRRVNVTIAAGNKDASVPCNNAMFGDPVVGHLKICESQDSGIRAAK